jgi:hypothetical protein
MARPPWLWLKSESKYFRFCEVASIDLGAQDLNDIQRPKSFKTIAGSKVLDEYYNSYLRK